MPRFIRLRARIEDDGRIYIFGEPDDVETTGLMHLLHPTDSFPKALIETIKLNDEAHDKGVKPER